MTRDWLAKDKSAGILAKEFGLNENLLLAWRKLLHPVNAGGKAEAERRERWKIV